MTTRRESRNLVRSKRKAELVQGAGARGRKGPASASASGRSFRRSLCLSGLGLALLLSGVSTARSQQFGQWWWEAQLRAASRTSENLIGGESSGRFGQEELEVSLGLNGFLIHPAVARFRLGITSLLTDLKSGGRSADTEQLGIQGDLTLFPRGAYPLRLYARRNLYDYPDLDRTDPLTLLGTPDFSDAWGGRLRVRRGPLRGLLLGVHRDTIDFLDRAAERDVNRREFVDWSAGDNRFHNRVRIERRFRSYGTVDFDIEYLTANLDQRGMFGERWRWNLISTGIERESIIGEGPPFSSASYRSRGQLSRTMGERDRFDLLTNVGVSRFERGSDTESYSLGLFYRKGLARSWQIGPFIQYAHQSQGPASARSPQGGVAVTWQRSGEAFDALLTAQASAGTVELVGGEDPRRESLSAWGLAGSLGHGDEKRLRKELEIEIGRNQVRFSPSQNLDLPDPGLPRDGVGSEDFARARLKVRHRWDSKSIGAWTEWTRRESSRGLGLLDFEADSVSATVQFGGANFNLQASAGESRARQRVDGEQRIDYVGGAVSWRPARSLRLNGTYRSDRRRFILTPDVDGERFEAGLRFVFGATTLEAWTFDSTQQIAALPDRRNRGVRWSISRRIAGWLPIVSSEKRRGVIR